MTLPFDPTLWKPVLYTIAKQLVLPPGGIILFLCFGFLLVRGVLGKVLLFAGIVALTLMSLPVVALHLIEPLESYPAIGTDLHPIPENAQGIVVLSAGRVRGAPEYGGDTVDGLTLQRLRYAARLYHETGLPVYVSGGNPQWEQGPALGTLMAAILENDFEVPVAGIETHSRVTRENADYLADMLQKVDCEHALLVTDAWHMPRAVRVFNEAGVRVTPAPTGFLHYPGWRQQLTYRDWLPSSGAFRTSYLAIHEYLGGVWYRLQRRTQAGSD